MTTLRDIKAQRNLTNAAIGRALGCSPSKASLILRGAYISVYTDEEITRLAEVLGVTFERCWLAMVESHNAYAGTPGATCQRYSERLAEIQMEMKERLPEIAHKIEVEQPRQWGEVEGVVVVDEEAQRLQVITQHEPTEEEKAAVVAYFNALFSGACPFCGVSVEQQEQVGRCVYARPCGHRLYQGEVGAFQKKEGE